MYTEVESSFFLNGARDICRSYILEEERKTAYVKNTNLQAKSNSPTPSYAELPAPGQLLAKYTHWTRTTRARRRKKNKGMFGRASPWLRLRLLQRRTVVAPSKRLLLLRRRTVAAPSKRLLLLWRSPSGGALPNTP
jgi:hypothetical protein